MKIKKQLKNNFNKLISLLQSKNNWYQLKRWLQIELECKCKQEYVLSFGIVLDKMKELEGGK